MNGRFAAVGATMGLAAGSALVVVPSASIRVTGASRPVSATARLRLADAGARSFGLGAIETEVSVPTTGVLPATPATGVVAIQYDKHQNLNPGMFDFLGDFGECFFTLTPGYCDPSSPPAPKRLTLPAGTRLTGCPGPLADPPAPPCPHPMALVTTAPVQVGLGTYSNPVTVRTLATGPAANLVTDIWLTDTTRFDGYYPHVGVFIHLGGAMQGGGDAGRPGVAQADLDKLAGLARTRLAEMATTTATGLLQPGETLATPLQDASVTLRPPDAHAGDVATEVSMSGAIDGRAVAVRSDAVRAAARTALELAAGAGHLLAGSVRWDPPQIEPGNDPMLRITAHGLATDLDSYAVRSAAAWHGSAHVADVVHRSDPHATVTVTGGFGWSPALVFLDRRAGVVVDGYSLN